MKSTRQSRVQATACARSVLTKLAVVSSAAIALTACRANHIEPQVAGWSVLEPEQRHPILVSQRPSTLNVRAPRGAYGLNPTDRSRLDNFLARYRSTDAGNSKLVIASPSGTPNEVAAMQVVAEIRHLASEHGFSPANVHVEAYHGGNNPQPPVRISYLRYVAEGPECGDWSTNLGQTTANTGHPDLGCTTQRNFAAMIANPADLIGPRGQTGRSGERRDENWAKYRKGESTVADKKEDERVKVKGAK